MFERTACSKEPVVLWGPMSVFRFWSYLIKLTQFDETETPRVDLNGIPEVSAVRTRIERISSVVECASLDLPRATLGGDNLHTWQLQRNFVLFSGQKPRLDQGGRLSGAFWLSASGDKLKHLKINGQRTSKLDYCCTHPMILYAKIGIEPPDVDAYCLPGLERQRALVKKIFNDLLYSPRATAVENTIGRYGSTLSASSIIAAIEKKHPNLIPYFGTGVAASLMFVTSEILLTAFEALLSVGVIGLPRHDSIIVPSQNVGVARSEMMRIANRMLGMPLAVSISW
jgi:hypothetical protein